MCLELKISGLFLLYSLCLHRSEEMVYHPDLYSSPCPQTFQYRREQNGDVYGEIGVYSFDENIVQLNVQLSVGNQVNDFNGQIDLVYPKRRVIDDVRNGRSIRYRVVFPRWENFPPRITKITVNGQVVCTGPPIPRDWVRIITTIDLAHTLTIKTVRVNPISSENNPFVQFNVPDDDFSRRSEEGGRGAGRRGGEGREQVVKGGGGRREGSVREGERRQESIREGVGREEVVRGGIEEQHVNFQPKNTLPQNPFINGITSTSTERSNTNAIKPSNIYSKNPFLNNGNANNVQNVQKFPDLSSRHTAFPPPQRPTTTPPPRPPPSPPPTRAWPRPTPTQPPPSPLAADVCGRPVASLHLIVRGETVPRGAFPWLAAMFRVANINDSIRLEYKCSGSLISKKHVLTAAHCVKQGRRKVRADTLVFVMGKLNIKKVTLSDGEKMIEAEEIIVHPDYVPLSADADIAIVILSEEVEFTRYIRPICLWTEPDDLDYVVGQSGKVVGWGKDEDNTMTAVPKQTTIPIVSQTQCLRSAEAFNFITSNRTFCAGDRDGVGPCNGDSGSGFIMNRNGRWVLRGVVSISTYDQNRQTCDLFNYVVFTDTSKFKAWLFAFIT